MNVAYAAENDPSAAKSRRNYIAATAVTGALGGFIYGYDGSILGAAILYLRDQFHLSAAMMGFVMASAVIGLIIGPFAGGWLCDRIGREKTLGVAAIIAGIGALGDTLTPSIPIFLIFRVICGFGLGILSIASPMYLAEMAPPRIRGKLGLTWQLAIVVGSFAAPLASYPISLYFRPEAAWRWMFATQLVLLPLLLYFINKLLPSPRWLAEKGRFDEAREVLRKVHEPHLADEELREIKGAITSEVGGWSELWRPGIRFALLIGFLLAFFNNWTGWSAMGGYITNLLEMAGVKSHSTAILGFAATYLMMSIMTVISMGFVDRLGRRPLWIFASFLMAIMTLAAGFVFYYHMHGWVVLVVLMLCTVPHGIALGGLPWLMFSEIFPNHVRAKAVTVTTTFVWIIVLSAGQLFPIFTQISTDKLGSPAGVFWLFTIICLFSALFGFTLMPETKGRSLEDISKSLKGASPKRN